MRDVVPETPEAAKSRRRSSRRSTIINTKASLALSHMRIAATPDSQDDRQSLKRTLIDESPFSQQNDSSLHAVSRRAAKLGISSHSPLFKPNQRTFHPIFNDNKKPFEQGKKLILICIFRVLT